MRAPANDHREPFFAELAALNITLFVEGDLLRFRAPKGAMTPELGAEIAAHRTIIIKQLTAVSGATSIFCTTCDRRSCVDAPPANGLIRTTCSVCDKFIGYRPANS